jgi:hypothetical protein
MDLAHQYLEPIVENCTALLGPAPDQLARFEAWAQQRLWRLRQAAPCGPAAVRAVTQELRAELDELAPPVDLEAALTERRARMRLCQRQWLTGLLDFVDELLATTDVPWAA